MNASEPHRRRLRASLVAVALAAALVGFVIGRCGHPEPVGDRGANSIGHAHHGAETAEAEIWTCAMHPQIQLPEFGSCPICGMDLIPLEPFEPSESSAESSEYSDNARGPRLEMSEVGKALARIETARVERRSVAKTIRMVGEVAFDETRRRTISAWVPGRIDRMYVDYAGIEVAKGDHLVDLYSPDLLMAQTELLEAVRATRELRASNVASLRRTAGETVEAAREKLRLLGLKHQQIRNIEQRGNPTDHMTIYAPVGGTVVRKHAVEGTYVQTGMPIYEIADLSKVWVLLDAYESDMAWLHYGQDVTFTSEAHPGEEFHGTVAFIDPVLDPATRTVNVRVNVENPDGKLKPEMFVRSVVLARIASSGKVMDARLEGKWIAPMHPEIVHDEPGKCSVCGMDLVSAESLGYARAGEDTVPLVIPASAPLITGERAVVYVEVPDAASPTFEGREVVLGPRAGDAYIVREGLTLGERVVVSGNFNIDSALQIRAKPSMMSPRSTQDEPSPTPSGESEPTGHRHP